MPLPKLESLFKSEDSLFRILAPKVGLFSDAPQDGSFLLGGSFIGKLRVLNVTYDLHLPADAYGRVIIDSELDKSIPVAYGQELFRLNPETKLVEAEKEIMHKKEGTFDIEEEGFIVRAFTDGIFYRRPSPDEPPFVVEGQKIEKGKALGLIEIMKTFNHIIFDGTDKSDSGVIAKILIDDMEEVKKGQPLFVIED